MILYIVEQLRCDRWATIICNVEAVAGKGLKEAEGSLVARVSALVEVGDDAVFGVFDGPVSKVMHCLAYVPPSPMRRLRTVPDNFYLGPSSHCLIESKCKTFAFVRTFWYRRGIADGAVGVDARRDHANRCGHFVCALLIFDPLFCCTVILSKSPPSSV